MPTESTLACISHLFSSLAGYGLYEMCRKDWQMHKPTEIEFYEWKNEGMGEGKCEKS